MLRWPGHTVDLEEPYSLHYDPSQVVPAERGLPYKLACQIQEGLFIVVVALSRNFVILQVLLSVEGDLLGLHLPVLDINLVATQDNRDVFTHPAAQLQLQTGIAETSNNIAFSAEDVNTLTDTDPCATLGRSCMSALRSHQT